MKLGLIEAIILAVIASITAAALPSCRPAQSADIVTIAGCVLLEYAKVAPGRMPTVAEAAQIALTCGARDEQQVLDLITYHRVAKRLEGDPVDFDAGARE